MKRWALMNLDTVQTITEQDEKPDTFDAEWLELPEGVGGPGWTTPDGGETWQAPAAAPVRRWITKLAFDDRFTQAESIAIEIGQLDDPATPMANRQKAAALRASQRKVTRATYIDLDRPDTRAGVMALQQAGLLGPGRALEILDAEIRPDEIYRG